eukprot:273331-Hanusia_phi.AAC.1
MERRTNVVEMEGGWEEEKEEGGGSGGGRTRMTLTTLTSIVICNYAGEVQEDRGGGFSIVRLTCYRTTGIRAKKREKSFTFLQSRWANLAK